MRQQVGIRAIGTHVHRTTRSSTTASQDGVSWSMLAFVICVHTEEVARSESVVSFVVRNRVMWCRQQLPKCRESNCQDLWIKIFQAAASTVASVG